MNFFLANLNNNAILNVSNLIKQEFIYICTYIYNVIDHRNVFQLLSYSIILFHNYFQIIYQMQRVLTR